MRILVKGGVFKNTDTHIFFRAPRLALRRAVPAYVVSVSLRVLDGAVPLLMPALEAHRMKSSRPP